MRRQPPRTREQPSGVPGRRAVYTRAGHSPQQDVVPVGAVASQGPQRYDRVATYWEAEALRSAVTTSEWIFIQRLRSRYYIKWRLYTTASAVHREYNTNVVPMTENLKQERARLKADLRAMSTENDSLKDELASMQQAVSTMQTKHHGVSKDFEDEAAMRRQLEKSLASERDRTNDLEEEREKLKKQLQDSRTKAQTSAKELEYLKKIADTKGKEMAREREEKKFLQQQLNAERKKSPAKVREVREVPVTKKTVSEKVEPKNYPELGLCLTDTLPRPIGKRSGKQKRVDGIKVVGVRGPAKRAGILPEDTLLAINGNETPDLALFRQMLTNLPPKDPLSIMIERNQQVSTVRVVPNASTEVPGHAFQRLVWLPRDDKPEADASISRLAAPKGAYYDDTGKLHNMYDDDEVRASPPGTPRSRGSDGRSQSPAKQSPRRRSSLGELNDGLIGCEGSWSWAPESPRRHVSPLRKQESIRRGDSPGSEMSGYTAMTQGTGHMGVPPAIRVGARVRRNSAYWQWGDQDGGPGNLGTVAKVDKVLGWVTVRWDATGKGSTYRWGKDEAWDVEEVTEGLSMGHSAPPMMGETTQRPPPQRTRTHHSQSIPTSTQSFYDEEGYSDASSDPGASFVPSYAPHPQ